MMAQVAYAHLSTQAASTGTPTLHVRLLLALAGCMGWMPASNLQAAPKLSVPGRLCGKQMLSTPNALAWFI
jgi:hypothetical protein